MGLKLHVLLLHASCVLLFANAQDIDGNVRLVNGLTPAEGRVEVYYQGEWGSVCDDGWDMAEANVVCRQLGFSSANATHCCAHFGQSDGQIMLDDLGCIGDESDLGSCNHRGWATHNCAHTEDASVVCNGKFRLVGGEHAYEGRVEVFMDGRWGSICNVGWDMKDAGVVCRLMNYPSVNSTTQPNAFGDGSEEIIVSDVACEGTEQYLSDCPQNVNSTCPGQGTDPTVGPAGVRCTRPIRLVGGASEMEGHVEIYDNGRYGPICDQGWDMNDARVVCRQLGNLAPVQAVTGSRYGTENTTPLKVANVNCGGTEDNLEQCGHGGWNNVPATCSGSTLAGVVCAPAVRIVGTNQLQGRAEIYKDNAWGSICADSWDAKDAKVFCEQLGGYPVAPGADCCSTYALGQLSVSMGDVQCTGNETYISDCVHRTNDDCSAGNVVGIKCMSTVRLYGGPEGSLMGNVEVLYNGEWGSICDDNWDINDARVVCRQLGNYEAVSSSCCSHYHVARSDMILDDLSCTGTESKIEDCYHSPWGSHNCGESEAAGVSCRKIRLVSEESTTLPKGRVEVVINGRWGRICGEGWGEAEANVLCRQLYNSTSEPHSGNFGRGLGPVHLRDVQCTGDETDIMNCANSGIGDQECTGPDAMVVCRGGLRLADGRTPLEGRVEIFQDGQWGTICDDNWDIEDARVVCRQLGNYEVMAAKCCAAYGHGTGPILLDGVGCEGNEEILEDCSHEGWGTHNCQHYEDASVACTDLRLTYSNGTVATNKLQGRIEVWQNQEWKAVCADNFRMQDAAVVCRQLFNTDALRMDQITPSEGVDIGIHRLRCTGNETLLTECPNVADAPCSTGQAAAVVCKDIRLTNGDVASEGAVEILENGNWGMICGNMWGMEEGQVACSQLGFCSPRAVLRGWDNNPATPTGARREMHWHDMNCTGEETRLRDCPHSQGSFPCNGFNFEASVVCRTGCDPLTPPRHSTVSPVKDMYEIGETITFTCEDKYDLIGSGSATCDSDCGWNSELPECQLKSSDSGGKGTDGKGECKNGSKTGKSTQSGGGGPVLFFVGLIIGSLIILLIGLVIWLVRVRRQNTFKRFGTTRLTGNTIFKPKARDDMEEPVLSFNQTQAGGDDGEDGTL